MPFLLPDPRTTLRLHLNENTAGCSPAVLDTIRGLDALDVSTYPNAAAATTAAEKYFGVEPGWVHLTDGLDDGLRVVAEIARLRPAPPGGERSTAVVVDPAFEMYEVYITGVGFEIVRVPPGADFVFPADSLARALTSRTRLVYLTDPNNPTGQPIPAGTSEHAATALPNAFVVQDEAYSEFSGRTIIGPALDRHRNLLVGRTFSKAFGLAGMRVGALVAHPDTLEPMRRALPPFAVNAVALRALEAALADRAHLAWYLAQVAASKQAVYDFCAQRGLRFWRSDGNFVLVQLGDRADEARRVLAADGILISGRNHQVGCAGAVRITTGILAHTSRCLEALGRALESFSATSNPRR
jgi:histidinol-phosphate aminotransferase